MKQLIYIRLLAVLALSGISALAFAQQPSLPSVTDHPVPIPKDKITVQIPKGTVLGYVSWTNAQENDSHPSKNLLIASQQKRPGPIDPKTGKPKTTWFDSGTVTLKKLTQKNGRYTRNFTVTKLPPGVNVFITAQTSDGEYDARQVVVLPSSNGIRLSLALK